MADIKICDRCGKKIVGDKSYVVITRSNGSLFPLAKINGCDLCHDCTETLNRWLKNKHEDVYDHWAEEARKDY